MTRHWLNRLRQKRYTCRQWSVAQEKNSVTTRLIIYTCTRIAFCFSNARIVFFFLLCRFQSFSHAAIKTCVTVLLFISLAVSGLRSQTGKQNIFCEIMSWCCWCSLVRSSSASITQTNRRPSLLGAVVSPQPAATRWHTHSAETRDENAIKVITSPPVTAHFSLLPHTHSLVQQISSVTCDADPFPSS